LVVLFLSRNALFLFLNLLQNLTDIGKKQLGFFDAKMRPGSGQ
jgi:hypothetical protein